MRHTGRYSPTEDEFDIDIFESGFVNTIGEIYTKLEK